MSISSTTIHNSCKKLAQLNRVIEYLTSYIEEVHLQTTEIEKNVDAEFQTIFKNYEKKADIIFSSIKEQEKSVVETIQVFYIEGIEKEKQKTQEKKQQVLEFIRKEENKISNEIQSLLSTILHIGKNLKQHLETFHNENYMLNLQTKINDLEEQNKIEYIDLDKEINKKILKLRENSLKQSKDIEKHFQKVKNDLIISYEKENPVSLKIKKELIDLISKLSDLKSQISTIKKDINSDKIISSQNFSGFKARLHSEIDKLKIYKAEKNDELQNIQKQNEEIYNTQKIQLKEQKSKRNNVLQSYENEIVNLQNEQRIIKSQNKSVLDKLEKQNSKKISYIISDIEEKIREFQNKIKEIKDSINKNEEEIKLSIISKEEQLKRKNTEYKEIELNYNNSKTENLTKFSEEIEKFKAVLNQEKEKEKEDFNNKIHDIQQLLNDQTDNLVRLEEANQQLKHFQNELEIIKSNFNSELSQIDNSPTIDTDKYDDEIRELTERNEKEFGEKQKFFQNLFDSENSTFSEQEEKYTKELEHKYQEEIKKVPYGIKDEDFKEKIIFYENEYKKVYQQLKSIKVTDKEEEMSNKKENDENLIENLEQKKIKLIEFISNEREEVIRKFEKEEKLTKENLPILIDQNSIQIDSSKIDTMKMNSKANIQNLQLIINEKESELLTLQEENRHFLNSIENFEEDDSIQKLRLELSSSQKASDDKIRAAKEHNKKAIKDLHEQIEIAEKQNEEAEKQIQSENDTDHKKFRETFQSESSKRKSLRNQHEEKLVEAQKKFEEARIQKIENFGQITAELKEKITTLRKEVNSTVDGQFEDKSKMIENSVLSKIGQLKNELDSEIEKLANSRNSLIEAASLEISRNEARRDEVKSSFISKPMRDEEKTVIEKLTEILNEETEKLKSVGMEFIDMRESLSIRDKQINQRFGKVPQVHETRNQKQGVRSRVGGASSALTRKKPLPPLAAPYMFI